jgi:hypothetical protein
VGRTLGIWLVAMAIGAICPVVRATGQESSAGERFAGVWSGSWEGGGASGGFELTLEKGTEGTVGGRVAVSGEPAYKAVLRSVVFDGAKMTARYDFPPDDRAEVILTTAFEGATAKGTWVVREKGGADVINGTLTLSRK